MLKHWVKTGAGAGRCFRAPTAGTSAATTFSKYNKKVDMLMYNDEEYENLLQFDEETGVERRRTTCSTSCSASTSASSSPRTGGSARSQKRLEER